MTDRIKELLNTLRSKEYRKNRIEKTWDLSNFLNLNEYDKGAYGGILMLENETPVFIKNDEIGFYRKIKNMPPIEWGKTARLGNITPNYLKLVGKGLIKTKEEIKEYIKKANNKQKEFYNCELNIVNAMEKIAKKYKNAAKTECPKLYNALKTVPFNKAESFYEAVVFVKFIIYCMRCFMVDHITLGGFDKYLYSYFENDLNNGVKEEELFETLENFFLSINFDTDIYRGVQQGDNGQSMVLGGRKINGEYEFNRLAELCLKASYELNIIDPKINMRVCKDTPFELYLKGTELTKKGLGFPQYCNDDVVIPGLIGLGYEKQDAYNYTVAACWEFIIPNCGCDVPNVTSLNFPLAVDKALRKYISKADTFDEFMGFVKKEIEKMCDELIKKANSIVFSKVPIISLLIDGCLENGKDITEGAKYHNFGCHGVGISNAADALVSIKKLVFEEKYISKDELIKALDADFNGYTELWHKIEGLPKCGNNDDYADELMCTIMLYFSDYLNGKKNQFGGIYRAGTGSAQDYIFEAEKVGATADGRKAYTPFASSYSPSITVKLNGPLSVMQSFTKFDFTKIINGGPLTMEFSSNIFRNEYGVKKVAQLVQWYILHGGHQLQLNAVNRETLLDAQKHPENYENLIVRVWGWSGYFNELDVRFQNHIIKRTEFGV